MRILLVTDAWAPQVNGVVVTLRNTIQWLERWGHRVEVLSPEGFRTMPMPTYPDIPLALMPGRKVAERIREVDADAIHIATEGPLGIAARAYCVKNGLAFTTAYHTCFPEYVKPRFGVPLSWTYAWLKHFHGPSAGVLVSTPAIRQLLESRGFSNVRDWGRGVDLDLFQPTPDRFSDLRRPVFLYVGRVAAEKNVSAFLELDLPGSKLVVGEGHLLPEMRRRYPDAYFAGRQEGEALVRHYASADVFVLPSRTETFGLVLLEALACGLPVAALPVPGPLDIVGDSGAGVLDGDLRAAATAALDIPREICRAHALRFSWCASTEQFLSHVVPVRDPLQLVGGSTANFRISSVISGD